MTTDTISPNGRRSWTETPPSTPAIRRISGEVIEGQHWLDRLADPLQNALLKLFGKPRETRRISLKSFLNGTWLGHPLHPALTDIPIGAWTATLVFDLLWLAKENRSLASAADSTLEVGLAGAGAAALAGITDWSDTFGVDRRMGLLHGLLNTAVTSLNIGSWLLRRAGMRRTGIVLSCAGYLITLYSADLGGELSYARGVGVNHVAFEGGSDDFVAVMNEQELLPNKLTRVEADGTPVVLLKRDNAIFAIAATCSHMGGPLDEGTEQDCIVTCPWHGSSFHMSDGSVVNGPAVYAQPAFEVRVRDGKIELRRLSYA